MNVRSEIINLRDGVIWKTPLESFVAGRPMEGTTNPVVVDDTVVYVIFCYCNDVGSVLGFDAETGAQRWRVDLDSLAGHSGIHRDGKFYVASARTVYCIDIASGETRWTFTPCEKEGEWVYQGLVFNGKELLVGDRTGTLYGIDTQTEEPVWGLRLCNEDLNGTPHVAEECIYVTSNSRELFSVARDGSRILWRAAAGQNVTQPIVAYRSHVVLWGWQTVAFHSTEDGSVASMHEFPGLWVRDVFVAGEHLVVCMTDMPQTDPPDTRARSGQMSVVMFDGSTIVRQLSFLAEYAGFDFYERHRDRMCIAHLGGFNVFELPEMNPIASVGTAHWISTHATPRNGFWYVGLSEPNKEEPRKDHCFLVKVRHPCP